MDESHLTGESDDVLKHADSAPVMLSGTKVLEGLWAYAGHRGWAPTLPRAASWAPLQRNAPMRVPVSGAGALFTL